MLQSIRKRDFLEKENSTAPLPAEKSWTNLKTMQTIKSQGACGSCWAIAAVTTLEAATELHSSLRSFSAQEIVSCVPNPKECGGQGRLPWRNSRVGRGLCDEEWALRGAPG